MEILIVAATMKEIETFLLKVEPEQEDTLISPSCKDHKILFLITGIGIPNTIFNLTRLFEKQKFDLVINTGIAGAFNKSLKLGDVVVVKKDCFADLGYENGDRFIPFTRTPFIDKNIFPYHDGWMHTNPSPQKSDLPEVIGITVNRVHGDERSIAQMKELYHADIETMEGAAFAFCCLQYGLSFLPLRSISNYVEKRDPSGWNIELAITNLNKELMKIIRNL